MRNGGVSRWEVKRRRSRRSVPASEAKTVGNEGPCHRISLLWAMSGRSQCTTDETDVGSANMLVSLRNQTKTDEERGLEAGGHCLSTPMTAHLGEHHGRLDILRGDVWCFGQAMGKYLARYFWRDATSR